MKNKFSTKAGDIDSSVDEQYNNWESYELTGEFLIKVPPYDRSAFLRSLANKTGDMKQGDYRNIIIRTATHAYLYAATGYMNGSIENVYRNSKKFDKKIKEWKEAIISNDTSGETPHSMAEGYEIGRGGDNWHNDVDGYPTETGQIDDVDEQKSEGDSIGNSEESNGDFSLEEELLPGALLFTDDARALEVTEYGTTEEIELSNNDEGSSLNKDSRNSDWYNHVANLDMDVDLDSPTAKTNALYHRLTALVRGEEVGRIKVPGIP